ncbi:MAG: tetratricopeptide repeat protein [Pyrinomonadaceae bacterium]|nr:tetratricopeptide repeat protein [Pyrinomonadaceae bacterium]
MKNFLRALAGNRLVLQGLLAALMSGLATGLVCAQDIGGGSTADFKRPSNPKVNRQPKPDGQPAGGRLSGTEGAKSSSPNPQPRERTGAPPLRDTNAGTVTAPRPAGTPKPAARGGLGGLGIPAPKHRPPPADQTQAAKTATAPTSEIVEDVEDALEAGNTARDQKPPNYAEAERAYNLAAKLEPNDWRAFVGLGNIYLDQGRDEEAIPPYRRAVELKSKSPEVFEALGDVYFRLERYEESIAASSESVRLDSTRPGPFWTLTWVNLTIGKSEEAGNNATTFVSRWKPSWSGDSPYYITYAGYLGYREAGRKGDAQSTIDSPGPSSECPDNKWHCRLLKYLRHEITDQQLISEANTNDKMTEARSYIGLDLAFSGRRAEGLPHLRWVLQSGNRQFVEYHLAKAWITRLEK